jgi:hypothetical protein
MSNLLLNIDFNQGVGNKQKANNKNKDKYKKNKQKIINKKIEKHERT